MKDNSISKEKAISSIDKLPFLIESGKILPSKALTLISRVVYRTPSIFSIRIEESGKKNKDTRNMLDRVVFNLYLNSNSLFSNYERICAIYKEGISFTSYLASYIQYIQYTITRNEENKLLIRRLLHNVVDTERLLLALDKVK